MNSQTPEQPVEGFVVACRMAGKEGWKLAWLTFAFSLVAAAITIWLPEFVGKLFYSATIEWGRAGTDGRLATLALGNAFVIMCSLLVVPRPIRRQQYPFLYLILTVVAIFSVLAVAATFAKGSTQSDKPDLAWIGLISWITTLVTVICALVSQAAKVGEEKILSGWQPKKLSDEQADDYQTRVGSV